MSSQDHQSLDESKRTKAKFDEGDFESTEVSSPKRDSSR
jgi:hypothetical protein